MASDPEIRITAMAPCPAAVAIAQIVSIFPIELIVKSLKINRLAVTNHESLIQVTLRGIYLNFCSTKIQELSKQGVSIIHIQIIFSFEVNQK